MPIGYRRLVEVDGERIKSWCSTYGLDYTERFDEIVVFTQKWSYAHPYAIFSRLRFSSRGYILKYVSLKVDTYTIHNFDELIGTEQYFDKHNTEIEKLKKIIDSYITYVYYSLGW